jgi:DNA-binding transcriptional regulator YhcF (GntR family)
MRLWISHRSEVPIREQLATQIVLSILSADLKPGARLPSTRELARRFRIHPNTVSAVYRELENNGWLELRRGSGVYIRKNSNAKPLSPELGLDHLIADLFRSARELRVPLSAVRARLRYWLDLQPPDHFLLIEPDAELREIVLAEIKPTVTFPVKAVDLAACEAPEVLHGSMPLVLPSKVDTVRAKLPAQFDFIPLRLRSVTDSLASWMPARQDVLVAIASRWPDFLKRAQTMLIAAGFDPDCLIFCDVREPGWQKSMSQVAGVICDSLTATRVPKSCRAIIFPLLSEDSIAELRQYEEFVRKPLA